MRLLMVGINHRTAPVALREQVAMDSDQLARCLPPWRTACPASEIVVLSTCNRTEVYIARPVHEAPDAEQVLDWLSQQSGLAHATLKASCIVREQEAAVRHLFRVAVGLDSMVLGESQVLGQVKRAYESAITCETVGPALHRIFQQAMATAKQVRTRTGIGRGRLSVGSLAVDFARQIFDHFDDKSVACLGAGEMTKLMLRHLTSLRPRHTWILNRSQPRAMELAESLHLAPPRGGVRPWEDLAGVLGEVDILLTSTGAEQPIITMEMMQAAQRQRRRRPLLIVDVAMPRDCAADIGTLSNVYLYNLDDLRDAAAAASDLRDDEAQACEQLVGESAAHCLRDLQSRDFGHLVRQLRNRLHELGDLERQRTRRKLAQVASAGGPEEDLDQVLEEHTRRLINKILHLPLSQLDREDDEAPVGFYAAALRRLFDLHDAMDPLGTRDEADDSAHHLQNPVSPASNAQSAGTAPSSPTS